MNDLIRRSDAIKAFEDVLDCDFPFISEETPRERIEAIPTAEPKRGEWIEVAKEPIAIPVKWGNGDKDEKIIYTTVQMCSECGYIRKITDREKPFKYCPNCGARMKGADDEKGY